MRILAVDDDPIFLDLLRDVLCAAGYDHVDQAGSAEEALTRIQAFDGAYDCFLLDVRMPGTDGVELCRMIRDMPAYKLTPVLMLTAVLDDETVDRAFHHGATDYVMKPLRGLELGARIRTAAMLANQTRQAVQFRQSAEQMRARLDNLTRIHVSAPLDLVAGPTCISLPQLEGLLNLLPDGGYLMTTFALRITEVEEIHASLSSSEFYGFLCATAREITARIAPRTHYLAYCGEGVYAGVIFGRDSRAGAEERPNALKYGGSITPTFAGSKVRKVQLAYNQSAECVLMSGKAGAEALNVARQKASEMKKIDVARHDLDKNRLGREVIAPREQRIFLLSNRFSRGSARA